MKKKVRLRIVEGPLQGKQYEFDQHDTFLFGRAPECHASLDGDSFVSRYHFLLEINPPHIRLRDLGSLNGTSVNNVCIGGQKPGQGQERDLQHGDRIQVGKTVIEVDGPVPAEQPRTPRCANCGAPIDEPGHAPQSRAVFCNVCKPTESEHSIYEQETVLSKASDAIIPGYAILKKLGEGGRASVYLAQRTNAVGPVAVKFLRTPLVNDARARSLFLREMEQLRALRHVNIVACADSGTTRDGFYITSEYCNKGAATGLLEHHGGKLPLELAIAILRQLLRGLEFAHAHNYVHRGIRPRNVLIHGRTSAWKAKIADFGLSRNLDAAGISGLTATGGYVETAHFMPREQLIDFKRVSPASDVWSIAATFYALATGAMPRPTRPEQDPIETLLKEDPVPIQERLPEIPAAVAEVIGRALAPNPEDRYPAAAEFRAAFKEAL